MPIQLEHPVRAYDQETFHAIDRQVMGIVFGIHNEFGRFLDELLFKREIATRCVEAGLSVSREFRIQVSHGSFETRYFVDLLIGGGIIFEAKTVECLAPPHTAQALNYLYLTGTQHGKLVNLRPQDVHWQFVSTQLTDERRREINVVEIDWQPQDDSCRWLQEKMIALLSDWGAFLETNLYRSAITHFLGGKDQVLRPIPVGCGERIIGEQKVHLLSDDTTFAITAIAGDRLPMQTHLSRFLNHTSLQGIAWVNLNHHEIEFTMLRREAKSSWAKS